MDPKTPAKYLEAKKRAYHEDLEGSRARNRARYHKHRDKRVLDQRERYQANKLEVCRQRNEQRRARQESGLCACGDPSEDGKLTCRACRKTLGPCPHKQRSS